MGAARNTTLRSLETATALLSVVDGSLAPTPACNNLRDMDPNYLQHHTLHEFIS